MLRGLGGVSDRVVWIVSGEAIAHVWSALGRFVTAQYGALPVGVARVGVLKLNALEADHLHPALNGSLRRHMGDGGNVTKGLRPMKLNRVHVF